MNAKPTIRLRLECLETRSLLSAIGLPLVPAVAPSSPLPAVLGDLHPIDSHSMVRIALGNVPNAATMSGAIPISTPNQSGDSSYAQLAAGDHFSVTAPTPDLHRTGDATNLSSASDFPRTGGLTNATSVSPVLNLDASSGLVDSSRASLNQGTMVASPLVIIDSAAVQGDRVTIVATIDAASSAPGMEMPRRDSTFLQDSGEVRNEPVAFQIHAQPERMLAGDAAPLSSSPSPASDATDVPPLSDPGMPAGTMDPLTVVDISPVLRPWDGTRAPVDRTADPMVQLVVVADPPSNMDLVAPAPPVKATAQGLPIASESSRVGDPLVAALETSPPTPGGSANVTTSLAAYSDPASSNSTAGGMIVLDDTPAAAPRPGNTLTSNSGFQTVEDPASDQGALLTSILPNVRLPASAASRRETVRAETYSAANVSSRPPAVILPTAAGLGEGGGIELAMAAAPAIELGDNSQLEGNAAQQLSDIRPESGVGLFCDIEVAEGPALQLAGSTVAVISGPNTGSLVVDAGMHAVASSATTQLAPPLPQGIRPTLAGLAENFSLLLGVTLLVSRGGLRLEEEISERERHLYPNGGLRQS